MSEGVYRIGDIKGVVRKGDKIHKISGIEQLKADRNTFKGEESALNSRKVSVAARFIFL